MFYVYELINTKTNKPFYVGFGKHDRTGNSHDRYDDHLKESLAYKERNILKKGANLHKIRTILKLIDENHTIGINVVGENLCRDEALDLEIELILKYGRRDLGTGILTNLTPGGDGISEMSEEQKKKISDKLKGRISPTKGKILGPYDEERIEASSIGQKKWISSLTEDEHRLRYAQNSRPISKETCEKISKSLKGRPSPMKGKIPWNKGLTKDSDDRLKKLGDKVSKATQGRKAPNKGKNSPNKGKTYEEIYGVEKAKELKEKRRLAKKKYWSKDQETS